MRTFIFFATIVSLSLCSIQAYAYQEDLVGLLSTYVKPVKEKNIEYNGVDYDGWAKDKRHTRVRKSLQQTDLETLKTAEEKLAFWINAYNFFIIDLIIQKGERDSIKDLSGAAGVQKRYKWSIDGELFTLSNIKDKKLHRLEDPRIHFALACAAKSCPDLRMEPYQAKKIDDQLSDQVKRMLQSKTKGFNVVEGNNIIRITEIMEIEKEYFNNGNIKSWLQPYFPLFINAMTKVEFFDFDWALNSQ